MNIDSKEINLYSGDAPDGSEFVTKSGVKIRNIYELYDVLTNMSEEDFRHHVNSNKNDFKNWIYHIVKDRHLAEIIAPMVDVEDMLSALEKRIDDYKHNLSTNRSRLKTDSKSNNKTSNNIKSNNNNKKTVNQTNNKSKTKTNNKTGNKSNNKSNTKIDSKSNNKSNTKTNSKKNNTKLSKNNNNKISKMPKNRSARSSSDIVDKEKKGSKFMLKKIPPDDKTIGVRPNEADRLYDSDNIQKSGSGFFYDHELLSVNEKRLKSKEFIYGFVIGIIIGLLLAKILML